MSLVETCVLWGTPLIHWQAGFVHLLCTEATCPAGQVSAHRQPGRAQAWRARGLTDGGARRGPGGWCPLFLAHGLLCRPWGRHAASTSLRLPF